MVAPLIPVAVAAGRVAMAVYSFAAPMVVRGAAALAPVAKSAGQAAINAAPAVGAGAVSVAGKVGGAALGAAKSVGQGVVGAGTAVVAGAPGFALDVVKSAAGFGGGAAASTSFGGKLADVAKAGLGSLARTGSMIALLYYAATHLRSFLSEKFFGAENLKPGQSKPLTPEEQASFDARAAQRDGAMKMTVVKDGVPRTVNVPSIPGESEEAALARGKGWWDKQAAEGKLPVAGEGMTVQMGGPGGSTFRLGKDGAFQKVEGVSGPGAVLAESGRPVGQSMLAGTSVGMSSEVITDPVRLGAISSLTGVADGKSPGGSLAVELRDVKSKDFTAVSIAPVGDKAESMRQGVTAVVSFNNGADSAVLHSKQANVGGASIERTVVAPSGDAVGVGADGRLAFKQNGESAKALTGAAHKVGRVGASSDSMTDALGASGRPTKGEVMISAGQKPYVIGKFETIGSDGVAARGAVTVSEGQAKMTVLGADGRTPVATHSVKDAGFTFDKDGAPAFSGKAQESLKAFAADPRGHMREAVGMSRDDGALKALTTPSPAEKGMGNPLQSLAKAGMER